jgi:hypothetical protein
VKAPFEKLFLSSCISMEEKTHERNEVFFYDNSKGSKRDEGITKEDTYPIIFREQVPYTVYTRGIHIFVYGTVYMHVKNTF